MPPRSTPPPATPPTPPAPAASAPVTGDSSSSTSSSSATPPPPAPNPPPPSGPPPANPPPPEGDGGDEDQSSSSSSSSSSSAPVPPPVVEKPAGPKRSHADKIIAGEHLEKHPVETRRGGRGDSIHALATLIVARFDLLEREHGVATKTPAVRDWEKQLHKWAVETSGDGED